jgi:hypothetical protein
LFRVQTSICVLLPLLLYWKISFLHSQSLDRF